MSHVIAIVGRPNVGKSTLFNRLIGERKAIIDDTSGVTRDRIYGFSEWNGRRMTIVDTGGLVHGSKDVFESAIASQVQLAIEEAHIILFLTDVMTGITDLDEMIGRMLHKSNKQLILVVNKVDNHTRRLSANEFWSLGFENTVFISSITGTGSGELLDMITEMLPPEQPVSDDAAQSLPKFSIIGQPNVGKSSFVNALLGEERNIVTEIAGTTRDSIHSHYNKFGLEFTLIDTAGIRKKTKVHEDLEFYSVIRAVKAIEEADVCLLLIEAQNGIEAQDMNIISLVIKRRKGLVLLVNKWDLMEKTTQMALEYEKNIKKKLAPFTDVPVLFVSVKEKQRIFKALEVAMEVYNNRNQKIKTSGLNEIMLKAIKNTPPPVHKGRMVKIKYVSQLPTYYPAFAFYCNHPKYVKASYKQFLENQLRKNYNFTGVSIGIFFREK